MEILPSQSVQRKVARGVAWVGMASALVAICDLVSLALILRYWATVDDYGTASAVMTMLGAACLLGEAGLPASIVQREHGSPEHLSSAFWFGLMVGVALYALVWVTAPLVAIAFDAPILAQVSRAAGIMLVLRPFYTTHQAMLRQQLRFKELSVVRVLANLGELGTKVGTAVAGMGLWCFVIGPLVREAIYAIGVPLSAGWRPSWVFRPRELLADFRFGLRATGGELAYQLYSNFDYQVVAYAYGLTALGYYRAAYELVLEPVRFVSGVVTTVAFPAFSRLRADRASLVDQLVAFTRQNLAVVLLFVAVIVVTADDVLRLVYGADFVIAAGAARILAIVGALRAMSFLGPPLLDGVGRSDLSLRYQLIAASVLATVFILATHVGSSSNAIAAAWAIGYPIPFAILARMVLGQLGITAKAYFRRIARLALIPAVGAGCGLVARLAVSGASPGVRFLVAGGVVIAVTITGLVRFEGYSPAAIAKRLRA